MVVYMEPLGFSRVLLRLLLLVSLLLVLVRRPCFRVSNICRGSAVQGSPVGLRVLLWGVGVLKLFFVELVVGLLHVLVLKMGL